MEEEEREMEDLRIADASKERISLKTTLQRRQLLIPDNFISKGGEWKKHLHICMEVGQLQIWSCLTICCFQNFIRDLTGEAVESYN